MRTLCAFLIHHRDTTGKERESHHKPVYDRARGWIGTRVCMVGRMI